MGWLKEKGLLCFCFENYPRAARERCLKMFFLLLFSIPFFLCRGNIFWNGDSTMPIGIEPDSTACASTNPTCNYAQLLADNTFNTINPQVVASTGRPSNTALTTSFTKLWAPIPSWTSWEGTLGEPAGATDNSVPRDADGELRAGRDVPGWLLLSSSS